MGTFLLSIASPEFLSWIGFVVLGAALVGEAGICVVPAKWDRLHRELAFSFAVLAAVGYAIERVGDEAILHEISPRATAAEERLKSLTEDRVFSKENRDKLVGEIKAFGGLKSPVTFDSIVGNAEAQRLGKRIAEAVADAIGKPIAPPRGVSACLECVGVWVCLDSNALPIAFEDARKLVSALKDASVAGAEVCTDPRNGIGRPDELRVIVGSKPPLAEAASPDNK